MYSTLSAFNTAVASRLSTSMWVNSCLMLVIANYLVHGQEMKNKIDQQGGLIYDVLFVLLGSVFITPLSRFVQIDHIYRYFVKRNIRNQGVLSKMTQQEANFWFEKPGMDLANHYAIYNNLVMMAVFFMSIFPLALFLALLGVVFIYLVDKYLLLRVYSMPRAKSAEIVYSLLHYSDFIMITFGLSQMIFDKILLDTVSVYSWIIMIIALTNYVFGFHYLIMNLTNNRRKLFFQNNSEYEKERVKFLNEYDRANPVTQGAALINFLKYLQGKDSQNARNVEQFFSEFSSKMMYGEALHLEPRSNSNELGIPGQAQTQENYRSAINGLEMYSLHKMRLNDYTTISRGCDMNRELGDVMGNLFLKSPMNMKSSTLSNLASRNGEELEEIQNYIKIQIASNPTNEYYINLDPFQESLQFAQNLIYDRVIGSENDELNSIRPLKVLSQGDLMSKQYPYNTVPIAVLVDPSEIKIVEEEFKDFDIVERVVPLETNPKQGNRQVFDQNPMDQSEIIRLNDVEIVGGNFFQESTTKLYEVTNIDQSNNYLNGQRQQGNDQEWNDHFANREEMSRGFRNTRINPNLQQSELPETHLVKRQEIGRGGDQVYQKNTVLDQFISRKEGISDTEGGYRNNSSFHQENLQPNPYTKHPEHDSYHPKENYLPHKKNFVENSRPQPQNASPNLPKSANSKHNPGSPPTGYENKNMENPLQEVVNFMSRQVTTSRYNSDSIQGKNLKDDPNKWTKNFNEVDSFENSLISNLGAQQLITPTNYLNAYTKGQYADPPKQSQGSKWDRKIKTFELKTEGDKTEVYGEEMKSGKDSANSRKTEFYQKLKKQLEERNSGQVKDLDLDSGIDHGKNFDPDRQIPTQNNVGLLNSQTSFASKQRYTNKNSILDKENSLSQSNTFSGSYPSRVHTNMAPGLSPLTSNVSDYQQPPNVFNHNVRRRQDRPDYEVQNAFNPVNEINRNSQSRNSPADYDYKENYRPIQHDQRYEAINPYGKLVMQSSINTRRDQLKTIPSFGENQRPSGVSGVQNRAEDSRRTTFGKEISLGTLNLLKNTKYTLQQSPDSEDSIEDIYKMASQKQQYISAAQYESVQVRPLEDDSKSTMQFAFEPHQFEPKKSSYIDLGMNSLLKEEQEFNPRAHEVQNGRYINRQNQQASSKSYLRKASNQQSQKFGLKRPSEDEPSQILKLQLVAQT